MLVAHLLSGQASTGVSGQAVWPCPSRSSGCAAQPPPAWPWHTGAGLQELCIPPKDWKAPNFLENRISWAASLWQLGRQKPRSLPLPGCKGARDRVVSLGKAELPLWSYDP